MSTDPEPILDATARATLESIADHLIPEAYGMPSARDVVTDARLRFVLTSRPDLREPFMTALRPGLGEGPAGRLEALTADPTARAALLSVIVFAYYTDATVRERLGYPGQIARTVYSWKVPEYIDEGLIEAMVRRGPIWRDPATGRRAVAPPDPA